MEKGKSLFGNMKVTRVKMDEVRKGMILADDVISADNDLSVKRGMIITDEVMRKLIKLGVTEISIYGREKDGASAEKKSEETEILDEANEEAQRYYESAKKAREQATNISENAIILLRESINDVITKRALNISNMKQVVKNFMDAIIVDNTVINELLMVKTADNYIFSHSVKVCILSILVAMHMKMTFEDSQKVGLGGLMHDIGMLKVSEEIINKKERLTKGEFEEIKRHTVYGREMVGAGKNVNPEIISIVYSHHERENGTGYPDGISNDVITLPVKIVSVADVYDALTSQRTYRERMSNYEAMKLIISESGTQLNSAVVNALIANVSLYPVGTRVRLNNGDTAVVIGANKKFPMRPKVSVIQMDGDKIIRGEEKDLLKHPEIFITGVDEN